MILLMLADVRVDAQGVRRLRRALVATLAIGALASALPTPARAQESEPLPPATPGPLPPPDTPVPPAPTPPPLAAPRADEAGRRQAESDLRTAVAVLNAAKAVESRAAKQIPAVEHRIHDWAARVDSLGGQEQEAARQLTVARERMRGLAVASYVTSGPVPSVDYLLRARDPEDLHRRRVLVDSAADIHRAAADTYEAARRTASEELQVAVRELARAHAEQAQVVAEAQAAAVQVERAAAEVDHRKLLLELATAAAPVDPSDIPRLFLDAYRRAAATLLVRSPNCRVRWTAIAAIGRIEANHGRYRDTQMALNGDLFPRILGIPLDGTRNTRLITDTDGGALDTDTVYDRAVGPMQFIPSTWKRMPQDGNYDGVSDPNNAYDAALGTAVYLCRAVPSGGLDTEEALRPAFFSYNHSNAYVELVLSWTRTYDEIAPQLPPPPPPPPPPAAPKGKGKRRR